MSGQLSGVSQMNRGSHRPARRTGVDDIPVARRSTPAVPVANRVLLPAGLAAAGLLLALGVFVLLRPQPLLRLLAPPPVQGLDARTGWDGRLLGHFPYSDATPTDLVAVAPGLELHRDAAEALLAMQRDAADSGVDLVVLSGYRSIPVQNDLFFAVKSERNQSARERAMVSAPPGFSEHSTGYAVDLGDGNAPDTNLSESFEQTAGFAWLQAHAARYHFSLSFPRGNAQGVSYEPWHWRFEGSAEALKLFEPAQRLAR
jgi:D-alanyl-D-alanine carboxypeptidase